MEKQKRQKQEGGITALLFQACVVADSLFGRAEQLFVISKLIMLAFFCVVLLRILYKGKVRVNQILLLPILFTLYCGATAFWAYNTDSVMSQMITQVQLLGLLLCTYWVMNDGVTLKHYLQAQYMAGIGLAIFALIRYGGVTQFVETMLEGSRMGGEVTHENTFGMVFTSAALSASYYFVIKKKRIHIASFAVFTFFAFSSGSRKAMLMIVGGLILISLLHYGIRRIYRTLLLGAAVVGAIYCMLQLPAFSAIWKRISRTLSGEMANTYDYARYDMIRYGLELFWERPILGYGINNFKDLYILGIYSHNNYIELLVGGGLIALIMYYLMFLLPAAELLFAKKKGEKLSDLHLMFWVWLIIELIYAFAMVQMYNKGSWILAGVLMAEATKVATKKQTSREIDHDAGK